MTDEFEFHDAPYLLGTLEPDEHAAFERHLFGCPECAARVDELRPAVAALRSARDAGVAEPPPELLLPQLLRRAVDERRRRRVVTAGTSLLAAGAVVALLVVVLLGRADSAPRQPAAQSLQPVAQTSKIHATATLVERRWGTQIDLRCRYDKGFTPRVPYDLVVVGTDQARHPAGSWLLVPGAEMRFTGGTDLRRAAIASIEITRPDGMAILRLAVG